jgi:RNA polymerase sigma factor (sigma-70 family)
MMMMTDGSGEDAYADFIRRIRAGDARAAEDLVRRYEPEIRLEVRTCLRLRDARMRRVLDSMDVCQSVMASFFVRASVGEFDLDEPSQLIRLLVGMARNKLADQVKHHQRRRRDIRRVGVIDPLETHARATDETPSQLVAAKDLLQKFRDRLSEDERRVADLRSQGFDWAAVAREIGGTPEARRKQLTRAVQRVNREFGFGLMVE